MCISIPKLFESFKFTLKDTFSPTLTSSGVVTPHFDFCKLVFPGVFK